MKNTKINLLLMTALLAVQTVAHAEDDKKLENKQPRTWQQAAYENRYGIAAGAAALSLGTLGYVYGGDFMTWFNKLSPVEQEQVQQKLKGSVDQDLENIQHQQKSVVEQEAIVAEQEQGITQAQQQVAEKQSWLQYILNMRKNDPALNKIQEELALNPEDRSSDDDRSEEDSAQYQKDLQYAEDTLNLRNEGLQLPKNEFEQKYNAVYESFHADLSKKSKAKEIVKQKYDNARRNLEKQHRSLPADEYKKRYDQLKENLKIDTKKIEDHYGSDQSIRKNLNNLEQDQDNKNEFKILRNREKARYYIEYPEKPADFDLAPFINEAQDDYEQKEQAINDAYNAEPAATGGYVSNFLSSYNPFSAQRETPNASQQAVATEGEAVEPEAAEREQMTQEDKASKNFWEDNAPIERQPMVASTSLMLEQTQEEIPNASEQPTVEILPNDSNRTNHSKTLEELEAELEQLYQQHDADIESRLKRDRSVSDKNKNVAQQD